MTAHDAARFARQLPLIGEGGQAALCAARVRVDGDGPAEAIARLYLSRAGVAVGPAGAPLPDAAAPGPDVIGEAPPLPELLGALAAATALVAALGVATPAAP